MNASLNDPALEVAYLGPEGSFAHLVAQKRYSTNSLIPIRSVPEVFEYLQRNPKARGIVPIENSSFGLIFHTVDGLIEQACSVEDSCTLFVQEELSIDVKLALLGRKGSKITSIYSHFAPLHHCEPYLRRHYPQAKPISRDSTSAAAESAVKDEGGAAIAPLIQAEIYGLDVLDFPLRKEIPNVTQFFVLGQDNHDSSDSKKTSFVVALKNNPGSLYEFLRPWNNAGINLTRIESRPIVGLPNTYRFFVEIVGAKHDPKVKVAIEEAKKVSTHFYDLGSYPVIPRYTS